MRIPSKKIRNLITPSNVVSIIALIVIIAGITYFIYEKNEEKSGERYYSVGEFSKYYLQDDKYNELIIEVDFVENNKPNDNAINLLKKRIEENCDKEKVIIYRSSFNTIPKTKDKYDYKDILELEKKYRDCYRDGNTVVLYYIYLNGEFEENSVVGLAYSASSCAIFKEKIKEAEFGLISEEDIEKAVVVHEFGHLLSLVNIGYESDREHEDKDHPHHCNHESIEGSGIYDCVMYWAIETTSIANSPSNTLWNQIGGLPNDFCEDCKHDLEMIKKNKEKRTTKQYLQLDFIAVDNSIFSIEFHFSISASKLLPASNNFFREIDRHLYIQ